jgi:hypothetical protein
MMRPSLRSVLPLLAINFPPLKREGWIDKTPDLIRGIVDPGRDHADDVGLIPTRAVS